MRENRKNGETDKKEKGRTPRGNGRGVQYYRLVSR